MRVMHFSAEPVCEPDLQLSAELRGIADALLPGKIRHESALEVVPQARPSDVDCQLNSSKPDIVHFSAHGEKDGLYLCDAYLDAVKYEPEHLASALHGMEVKVLVLNACNSWEVAKAVAEEVGVVIGTTSKVPDNLAIVFSEVFYKSLQSALPIGKAFELAMRELEEIQGGAGKLYQMQSRQPGLEDVKLFDPTAQLATAEPSAQHRMRGAAQKLESARYGARQEARANQRKFWLTIVVALSLSLLFFGFAELDKWATPDKTTENARGSENFPGSSAVAPASEPADKKAEAEAAARKSKVRNFTTAVKEIFGWVQINAWLLFTFFVAPPGLYLIEYFWLRRPLEDAEKAAFGLALKPPDSVDPDVIVERIEALVTELDAKNQQLIGGSKK